MGGYADFNATYYRVGKNAADIGEIDFIEFSSTISGKLLTDKGAAIFGAEVWAWSHEGGWASTTTGSDGLHLKAPGRWEAMILYLPKEMRLRTSFSRSNVFVSRVMVNKKS